MNQNERLQPVESAILIFRSQKSLCEKAMEQLDESKLFHCPSEGLNSIAIIVRHLAGNMKSRWSNFLTEDGEKDWRDRDGEFEKSFEKSKQSVMEEWESGWRILFETLDSLNAESIEQIVYIRGVGHTVVEAIQRQLSHYGYHTGQIVLISRMLSGSNWETLSIAKGKSKEYRAGEKH